jgi:hypothetical protein
MLKLFKSSLRKPMRMSTLIESQAGQSGKRFEGRGNTQFEALESLVETCKIYNIPCPELVPESQSEWHCGTILIKKTVLTTEKIYNSVFWEETNNQILCYVYL